MRRADREWLSLALMQSRNQTLAWIALFERHDSQSRSAQRMRSASARTAVVGFIAWIIGTHARR